MMGVFGSMSIRTSWEPLRKAGATAREMLVQAAAQQWKVEIAVPRREQHRSQYSTNERLTYGVLRKRRRNCRLPAERCAEDPHSSS